MLYGYDRISKNIKFNYKVKLVRSIYLIFKMISDVTIISKQMFEYIPLIRYCFIDSTVRAFTHDRLAAVEQISPIYRPDNSYISYTPKLIPSFIIIECGDINKNVYTKIQPYAKSDFSGLYIKKVLVNRSQYNSVIGAQFVYNSTYQSFN